MDSKLGSTAGVLALGGYKPTNLLLAARLLKSS